MAQAAWDRYVQSASQHDSACESSSSPSGEDAVRAFEAAGDEWMALVEANLAVQANEATIEEEKKNDDVAFTAMGEPVLIVGPVPTAMNLLLMSRVYSIM